MEILTSDWLTCTLDETKDYLFVFDEEEKDKPLEIVAIIELPLAWAKKK